MSMEERLNKIVCMHRGDQTRTPTQLQIENSVTKGLGYHDNIREVPVETMRAYHNIDMSNIPDTAKNTEQGLKVYLLSMDLRATPRDSPNWMGIYGQLINECQSLYDQNPQAFQDTPKKP